MICWKTIPFATALLVLQAGQPEPAEPLYRVTVVQGSAMAINYRNLQSTTRIDLKGTVLAADASGLAKVKSRDGIIHINATFRDLPEPGKFGDAFLTYVLWGISTEGQATNLGELIPRHGKATLDVVEKLQTFGLVVTAEPYFAVTQPSDVVVMENTVSKDPKDPMEVIAAQYELLQRGHYTLDMASAKPMALDAATPFDVYQARNAIRIARSEGAAAFATEPFRKAEGYLLQAEDPKGRTGSRIMNAREAVQRAEDARLIAIRRQATDRLIMETMAAQDKLEASRRETAQAEAGKQASLRENRTSATENAGLKTVLMAQFNAVLQTRATARGLIVNMSGMLFEPGKATLVPAAREKLAMIAGILLTHPGLKVEANGYTDSNGKDANNLRLSSQRAEATKRYLVSLGIPPASVTFNGFGKGSPLASNDTAAGRKDNRRVELVVSGGGVTPA